ncbi:MAG: hypothetical protein HC804_00660 [Anaerolineae bacterium]|nr:hypothetical protein [Anaerolineae bacterium]
MRTVEFRHLLDESNAIRVRFELDQGTVLKFMVQLECLIDYEWTAVVRYDTAHHFAHCDRLHPYEPAQKARMATQNYNEALTHAMGDLTGNWDSYRRRYKQWLKQK